MKYFKDLNKWSAILLILGITWVASYCWKQRETDTVVLESGNIEKAIQTQQ